MNAYTSSVWRTGSPSTSPNPWTQKNSIHSFANNPNDRRLSCAFARISSCTEHPPPPIRQVGHAARRRLHVLRRLITGGHVTDAELAASLRGRPQLRLTATQFRRLRRNHLTLSEVRPPVLLHERRLQGE